jgi:RimJ/RimL family protein N-acetyltransferase
MDKNISLLDVKIENADILLEWRNDPSTRAASHDSHFISKEEHYAWLKGFLNKNDKYFFVAYKDDIPVGSVRAVSVNGLWCLSWVIAPSFRGRGLAKDMLALLVEKIDGPMQAEVKVNNHPSIKVAEHIGMKLEKICDGFLYFRK